MLKHGVSNFCVAGRFQPGSWVNHSLSKDQIENPYTCSVMYRFKELQLELKPANTEDTARNAEDFSRLYRAGTPHSLESSRFTLFNSTYFYNYVTQCHDWRRKVGPIDSIMYKARWEKIPF